MIPDIFDNLLANITPKEKWEVKKWFLRRQGYTGIIRRTRTRRISVFEKTGKRSEKRNYKNFKNRFPKEAITAEDHGGGMFSIGC